MIVQWPCTSGPVRDVTHRGAPAARRDGAAPAARHTADGTGRRGPVADNGPVGDSELPVRLAGRVIAIDPAGRVLLFFYDDPPPKGRHWSTPGGGVEDGEDFHAAARRELLRGDRLGGRARVARGGARRLQRAVVEPARQADAVPAARPLLRRPGARGRAAARRRWRRCTPPTGSSSHRWWTLERARRDRRGRLPAGTRGPGPAASVTVSGSPGAAGSGSRGAAGRVTCRPARRRAAGR